MPQWSRPVSIVIKIFVNGLEKLGKAFSLLEGRTAIRRNLNRLQI